MKPKFTLTDGYVYVYNSFDIKDLLKANGFKYDGTEKAWYISAGNGKVLSLLERIKEKLDLLDFETVGLDKVIQTIKNQIQEKEKEKNEKILKLEIDAPAGLAYKNYQKEFVLFAKDRKYTILADEMGLGKTIQAIALMNYLKPERVLIVSPAFLKYNWQAELNKWLTYTKDVYVVNSKSKELAMLNAGMRGIFITNYDIMDKVENSQKFNLVVYDEAHYLKNYEAKRTYNSLRIQADRYLFVTGTPILNSGAEIVPLVVKIQNGSVFQKDHKTFLKEMKKEYWNFAYKYCYVDETKFGKKVQGIKNPEGLKMLLSDVLIRRTKEQVLDELPDKIRMIIRFDDEKELVDRERELFVKMRLGQLKRNTDERLAGIDYTEFSGMTLEEKISAIRKEIAKKSDEDASVYALIRHLLGLKKVKPVSEYVLDLIEQGENRVVVMSWHKDVAEYIAEELKKAGIKTLLNTGDTDIEKRQAYVNEFQSDKQENMVFVGTIKASGVGITLTKAKHLVFAEISYVPADIVQAEDRIHRIGQKADATIHFLIHQDSIDEDILKAVEDKEMDIEKVFESSVYKKVKI